MKSSDVAGVGSNEIQMFHSRNRNRVAKSRARHSPALEFDSAVRSTATVYTHFRGVVGAFVGAIVAVDMNAAV